MSGEGQQEKVTNRLSGTESSVCLQHFLYTIDTLAIDGLILQTATNAPANRTAEGVNSSFLSNRSRSW
jgi:hypothetical protein